MSKLSPEQLRVLRAAAEGRLTRLHYMGWFQEGGYEISGDRRNPRESTIQKLSSLGLIRSGRSDPASTPLEATDAGRAALGDDAEMS